MTTPADGGEQRVHEHGTGHEPQDRGHDERQAVDAPEAREVVGERGRRHRDGRDRLGQLCDLPSLVGAVAEAHEDGVARRDAADAVDRAEGQERAPTQLADVADVGEHRATDDAEPA